MFEVISRPEYVSKRPRKIFGFIYKILGGLVPFVFPSSLRVCILKACGMKIGRNVFIGRNCVIDDTFPELITIEDSVTISAGTIIFAHDASTSEGVVSRVTIRKGAYLGAGCIILPGVTVGPGAVIGAGAVVSRDVGAETVAVGVPAHPIQRKGEPRLYYPGRLSKGE
jgi:acetyltransferase-like isoleucine patch superfamily enzyme